MKHTYHVTKIEHGTVEIEVPDNVFPGEELVLIRKAEEHGDVSWHKGSIIDYGREDK